MSARQAKATSNKTGDADSSESEVDDSVAEDNPEEYLDPLMESPSDEDEAIPAAAGVDTSAWEDMVLEPLRVTTSRSSTKTETVFPSTMVDSPRAINIPLHCATASDFLSLLFTDVILNKFVTETNAYAAGKGIKKWTNLSTVELKNYFSIILYMGIVQRPGRSMYWDDKINGDEFVKSVMKHWRFKQISSCLHWLDTSQVPVNVRISRNKIDGFWTIEEFLRALSENFKHYYQCGQCINIDEMCVFFKGRHRCRCYNPKKPNKWHL